ncbi:MAG: DUF3592 domain-containing protein [Burkholderiales bacterium]
MDNATLVIAILAVIAVWAAFQAARRARWERERLDAEGELAEGEVLDVWPEGTAYRVRYRFTPRGAAEPVLRTEIAACLQVLVPERGDKVSVRYDPNDPKQRARLLRADERA